tara:strand:- start:4766 stop:6358 length:1593 start_codon:yes stop_codon:yes gene_type:complete
MNSNNETSMDINSKNSNKINYLILIIAISIFLINVQDIINYTVDDTFIGLRYAENLALGNGFSWNADGGPEFGFSNYLTVIFVSFGIIAGFDALLVSKFLSIFCGVLTIILLGLFVKKLVGKKFNLYFIPSLILALMPPFWIHSVTGMETTLFLFLVLFSSYTYITILSKPKIEYRILLITLLSLCMIARPEGFLITISMIVHSIFENYRLKRSIINRDTVVLFVPLGFLASILLWNNFYFGHYLPNPLLIKSNKNYFDYVVNAYYIFHYLTFLGPFVILGLIRIKKNFKDSKISYLIIQVIVFLIPYLTISQQMNYEHRFYFTTITIIILIGFTSFLFLRDRYIPIRYNKISTFLIILLLLAYPFVLFNQVTETIKDTTTNLANAHIKLGKDLANIEELENQTLATLHDAGAIPYYSKMNTYDYYLNDYHSAKNGFSTEYFFKQNPGVIVMTFTNKIESADFNKSDNFINNLIENQNNPRFIEILSDENFKDFHLVSIYEYTTGYYLNVFIHDDIILEYPKISEQLKQS